MDRDVALETVSIRTEDDVYVALALARRAMRGLPFTDMDAQQVLVSVSELTRNVLAHAVGGAGSFKCGLVPRGIYIRVTDHGPGILNLDDVLEGRNRLPTSGLGLGLAGVIRLMDDVDIRTSAGGTTIRAVKWTRQGRVGSGRGADAQPAGGDWQDIGWHRP
ncbi:MAG: ATP-binding protein [Alicyclobacillus sp.]|nr:ATP-binding protein [Alicyclobacillus sp.]